jgi:phosphatidate cytidylyltransferase
VVTGVLGGSLLVAVLVFGGVYGAYLVALVIALAMVYEFTDIAFSLPDRITKRWGLLLLAWLAVCLSCLMAGEEWGIFAFCFIALSTFFLASAPRHEGPAFATHYRELMSAVFGLFYLVFLPLYLPAIEGLANGAKWVITFLFIVFMGDTGAYFGGKKWGKRKLFAKISPKKTVEGAIAGLAAGWLSTILFKLALFREMSWTGALLLPLVVGAVAQVGDLCESFLKRAFDRKDSGTILPGHGGFLDRFDGIVFSLPIMYAGIKIFG